MNNSTRPHGGQVSFPRLTVGIAVLPETFEKIRAANGSPPLADVPPDQDVLEFELEFSGRFHTDLLAWIFSRPRRRAEAARLRVFSKNLAKESSKWKST